LGIDSRESKFGSRGFDGQAFTIDPLFSDLERKRMSFGLRSSATFHFFLLDSRESAPRQARAPSLVLM